VIGPWIAETQAQKVAAQAEIRSATGQRRMTRDETAAIVTTLGDLVQVIRDANPADKAELYTRQLGCAR
jgi:site-specific DNA recombinase